VRQGTRDLRLGIFWGGAPATIGLFHNHGWLRWAAVAHRRTGRAAWGASQRVAPGI
jgi:hypothetical protein